MTTDRPPGRDLADQIGRQIAERLMPALDAAVLRKPPGGVIVDGLISTSPEGTPMTDTDPTAGPTHFAKGGMIDTWPPKGHAAGRLRAEARADVLDEQLADAHLNRDSLIQRMLDRERDHTLDRLGDLGRITELEQRRDTLIAECERLGDALTEVTGERDHAAVGLAEKQRRIDAQIGMFGSIARAAGLNVADADVATMRQTDLVSVIADHKRRVDQLTEANAALRAALGEAGTPVVGESYQTVTPSGTAEHTEQAPVDPFRRAHDQIAKVIEQAIERGDSPGEL